MTKKTSAKNSKSEERLHKALVKLRDSDRYMMFRMMRVSHFLPEGTFGNSVLDQDTLEDLVEKGAAHIVEQKGVEEKTVKKLAEILEGFLKDSTSETAIELLEEAPPTMDDELLQEAQTVTSAPSPKVEKGQRSSIEAERLLQKAFYKLAHAASFAAIADEEMGKYWDVSGVRDPFLEEITFRQLLNIRIEYLLEKHSFTDSKVTAILKTIDKALINEHERKFNNAAVQNDELVTKESTAPQAENITLNLDTINWRSRSVCDALICEPILTQFVLTKTLLKDSASEIAVLLRELPKWITAREYVIWWIDAAYNIDLAAKLLHSSVANIKKEYQVCLEAIRVNFPTTAPVLYAHWLGALSGAGVPYDSLTEAHLEKDISTSFQDTLFKGLLKSLGAVNPSAFDLKLNDYWTTNPELLEMILNGVKSLPKQSRSKELAALLPLIKSEDLKTISNKIG